MHGVVKIHGLNTVYFLEELPEPSDDWTIEEGAWLDVADDPIKTNRPSSWTLAIS